MGFSLEFSGLSLVRLLRNAILLLRSLVSCWAFLSECFSSPQERSSRPRRSFVRAIKEHLHVTTYADLRPSGHAPSEMCAVCLSEMEASDEVRELRNCSHVLHRGCLDRWLDHDDRGTCPMCRTPLLNCGETPAISLDEPSWAVDRLLYLFGDDLPHSAHSAF